MSTTTHKKYDSNPLTTAWSGLRKLIRTNAQTVVGVALFNILLFVVLGLAVVVLLLSVFTFVFKHGSLPPGASLPSYMGFDFLSSMNDVGFYVTWVISLVLIFCTMALTQSLQLNLTLAAARGTSLKFGKLLKASIGSVPPLLGYAGLMVLACIGSFLVLSILATIIGPIVLIVAIAVLLAGIYAGLRLSFAAYSIIDYRQGPVTAIKNSWKLTSGHLIETVGSGAVAWLILAVPSIVVNALARITESMPAVSGFFNLLDVALLVVVVIAAAMSMSERYVQLQGVMNKELEPAPLSPFNYLAVALVLVLAPILEVLSPIGNQPLPGPYNSQTQTHDLMNGDKTYPTRLN